MTLIMMWVLITVNDYRVVSYSPPVADLESCQRIARNLPAVATPSDVYRPKCVEVAVYR